MKRFSEQFYKKAQSIKLNKAEQADLRDRIVSYMEYHPLPAEMKAAVAQKPKTTRRPVMTDPFATYRVPFVQVFKFGGVFAAIIMVAVPFVAERAVPGDTLYAVKVNFNEEVRSTLTWDPYEKVEWETVRLNRRIAEAKLLQKEGRLTEEVEAATAAAVLQHAENAKAEIETLRASDADTAAIATIELDSTLALQAQSLASDETDETATSTDHGTDLIAFALGQSLEKPINQATTSLPALPKLIARVEQHTTRVRELETTLAGQVDAAAMADVTRRIDDIERVAAEAFALPEASAAEAQTILVDVIARAQKLIVFMTELGVRETVTIESAVPVVLTEDEKNISRSDRLNKIDTYLRQLQATEIEDAELAAKLATIEAQLVRAKTELATVDTYSTFVEMSDNALALGKDAIILIEQAGVQVITPPPESAATSTEAVAPGSATTTDETVEPPVEPEATTSSSVSSGATTSPTTTVAVRTETLDGSE